jgi:hypothetical protein
MAIEKSNGREVHPGMLLSDSFEPDLSHTSILYYCNIVDP